MDNEMEYFNKNENRTLWYCDIRLNYSRFYNMTGANYADEDRLEEALEYFSKAISLDPHYAIAFFNRATIKSDLGDFEGARIDFHTAKSIEVENDNNSVQPIRSHLQDEISLDKNIYL
jgi:tetratricopeptide (TPR) repeat protein